MDKFVIKDNKLVSFNDSQISPEKTVIVPTGVEEICAQAFSESKVEEVILPSTVKTIGREAFANSTIKKITIPDTVTTFDKDIFFRCHELKNLVLPDTMKEIPDGFCYHCTGLQDVNMPSNLERIGRSAFYNTSLSDMSFSTIPDTVKIIDANAFQMCKLEKIKLPKEVENQKVLK